MNIRIVCVGVIVLLGLLQNVFGAPIDVRRAQEIAVDQLQAPLSPLRGNSSDLRLVYTSAGIPTRGSVVQQDYYVFAHDEAGYVVVAGDDNVPEVLGYSYESPFVTEDMPVQVRTWLNQCAQWVQEARKSGRKYTASFLETEKTPIAPLLGGMLWEQTGAFNELTPKFDDVNAPVGCVATALTQIMRYHAWPRKGRGAIKYQKDALKLYRRFDTLYDWQNMPNKLTEKSTSAQKRAVAILSRDVGFACRMNYGKAASGTSSENAMIAMRKFMRYANTIRLRNQDFYDYDEWTKICLDELKAKRPIYYSGAAIGVGHAFVCDGYDGAGRFHFNWGWGGLSNGYFVLTNLEPSEQSTGGGGEGGYVLGNQIITGLQPQDAPEPAIEVICEKVALPTAVQEKTTPIEVLLTGLWNYSYGEITAVPAVQVFDSERKVVLESHDGSAETLSFRYGYKKAKHNVNVSSLPNGVYTVRPAIYLPTMRTYYPVQVGVLNPPATFRVEGNKIVFEATTHVAELLLVSSSKKMNMKMDNLFEFTIQNNGQFPYRSIIAGIYSEAGDKLTTAPQKERDLLFNRSISLQPGEKQTFGLLLNGPKKESEHFLHILYDPDGGGEDTFPTLDDGTSYPGKSKFLTVDLTLEKPYEFAKYVEKEPPYTSPFELTHTKFDTYESGTLMRIELKLKAPADKGVKARILGAIFGPAVEGRRSLVAPLMSLGTMVLRPNEEREFVMEQIVYLTPNDDYTFVFFDLHSGQHQLKQSFTFAVTGEYTAALPIPDNSAFPDGPDDFDGCNRDMAVSDAVSHTLEGVMVAPNPASSSLNVYLPTDVDGQMLNIEVFDTTGLKVLRIVKMGERQLTLDVSNFSKGLYLLKVQCGVKQTTVRFIVE